MRVSLATHGGLAGVINSRRPARTVDSDGLPPQVARRLRDLVAAAGTERRTANGAARDAMSYTVTVLDDGRQSTLTGSDAAMSPAFAELIDLIERHATT